MTYRNDLNLGEFRGPIPDETVLYWFKAYYMAYAEKFNNAEQFVFPYLPFN